MPQSLQEVILLDGFGSLPNEIVVPFTASFSKYLIKEKGVGVYKKAYCALKETLTPQENVQIIENVYGKSESELLVEWRQSLLRTSR